MLGFINDKNMAVYFDSFVIEYTPPEVLSKIKDKFITHNIYKIQSDILLCVDFIVLLS